MPPVTHSSESHVDRDALSCAIDAANLGTWRIDMTTDRALDRSEHHDRLFGHAAPQPDWGFAAVARQVIDEDRPAFLAALAQARATGVLRCAVRVRWPDGSVHGLEFRGRTIRGAEDDQGVMAGTVADVGDSPAIEIRLRESELRLRLAQTLSDMGLFDWDIPGGASPGATSCCGSTASAVRSSTGATRPGGHGCCPGTCRDLKRPSRRFSRDGTRACGPTSGYDARMERFANSSASPPSPTDPTARLSGALA